MSYRITEENFFSLDSYWSNSRNKLNWGSIFVLPAWLKAWWQEFGSQANLLLSVIRKEKEGIIGIAPLLVRKDKAFLIGSSDVCDYLDFIVAYGMERDFFNVLLDDLRRRGINYLDMSLLRPDSTVLTHLVSIAQNRRYEVLCQSDDVSLELDLPSTWDEYLAILTTKQRHEVKRKLRRLSQVGKVDYYFTKDSRTVYNYMDTFLKMFTESRTDKAAFLTTKMESFFRSMVKEMTEAGLLRLGILELDALPVAMVICFDYINCMYLYNSGYNPQYNSLSVGLVCKVLCIRESIRQGKQRFDFLKGDEVYKYQLGGKKVPLSSCQITIK